jgi:hypothetical protein
MQRPRKFARFSVVRIVSRLRERANLFGEFGTVLGQEHDPNDKPVYIVDVYRAELLFPKKPSSLSEEVERKLFGEHELLATTEVDGFYGKSEPVAAARRGLARAIQWSQLYVCVLDYSNLHCPSCAEGIHFSENRLVEGLPKRYVTDLNEHPTGNIDRTWSYVMAFNRGLVRYLAATASERRRLLRHFNQNPPLKPISGFPRPRVRPNPKLSTLVETLEYGELALVAARGLTKYGLEGLSAMMRASANPDPFVKHAIISVVRQSADSVRKVAPQSRSEQTRKALVRMLVRYLQDEHWDIRAAAVGALHEFKAEPKLVVPALMKLLRDPEPGPRDLAVLALNYYGPKAKRALRSLREYCKTVHESERSMVQYAIRQIETGKTDGVAG